MKKPGERRHLAVFIIVNSSNFSIADQDESSFCDGTTGWTRIVHLNMTNASHTCPRGWYERYISGLRLCGRDSGAGVSSCTSVATFAIGGVPYSQECGQARGYQFQDVVAFAPSSLNPQINRFLLCRWAITHSWNGQIEGTHLDICQWIF